MAANSDTKSSGPVSFFGRAGTFDLQSLFVSADAVGWLVLLDRPNNLVSGDTPQPGLIWRTDIAFQLTLELIRPIKFNLGCWVVLSTSNTVVNLLPAPHITVRMIGN